MLSAVVSVPEKVSVRIKPYTQPLLCCATNETEFGEKENQRGLEDHRT